ncbi:Centrosome and spindle pole associated protein 1 [Liparis tanakae]|uniref:Centrosome and spindle pole associated protein 1 n=1 Tax=Liparis tanakae TaxID=230148 RepID=A0A4Z2JF85_9TELE|nr:Centrosome and spindle pole associated protein 1 [Liparis tanakae]
MYPDPPTDEQSLDIQQRALLREQQRKMRLMKSEEERDVLEQPLSHLHSRNKPGRSIHRGSTLPSEAAFIAGMQVEGRFINRDAASPQQSATREQLHGGDTTMMYGAEQYTHYLFALDSTLV